MKLSEVFTEYITTNIICGGLSDKTLESYQNTEKLLLDYFTDVKIKNITLDNIQKFYLYLLEWQSKDTARLNLLQLRAVFSFAFRRGYVKITTDEIKIPKREKKAVDFLTKTEVVEFMDVVAEKKRGYAEINRLRNIAILKVLWSSGVRVGELIQLNKTSIKGRKFTVVGKSKHSRPCFISQDAEKSLEDYLKMRTDNNPALFISNQIEKRMTAGGVREIFRRACKVSDFENVHPHTIRHSYATYLLDMGVDLRYISDLMGHESIETTKIYTHYTNPKLREIYEKIAF